MTQPGWYRDPVDEFEWRWWSGQKWTEDVRTGRFAGTSPLAPTPIPAQESALWSAGPYLITTHAAHVPERGRDVALPWWAVAAVTCTVSASQSLAGTGTLVLYVAYPGYTDRAEWRMRGIADADRVHALAYSWMRRHRSAAGYG